MSFDPPESQKGCRHYTSENTFNVQTVRHSKWSARVPSSPGSQTVGEANCFAEGSCRKLTGSCKCTWMSAATASVCQCLDEQGDHYKYRIAEKVTHSQTVCTHSAALSAINNTCCKVSSADSNKSRRDFLPVMCSPRPARSTRLNIQNAQYSP